MKPVRPWLVAGLAGMAVAAFVALGCWQLARLQWKQALIARVEQRVHAAPVPPPGPPEWPRIDAAGFEYRRVVLQGEYLPDHETLVRTTSTLGQGWWVLVPMRLADGSLVMVNRGFVPSEQRDATQRLAGMPAGPQRITGLLRLSEPGGAWLRDNDPAAQRWYSRDVQAIAARHGLQQVAPYFVDAEAGAAVPGQPQGGLTVLAFRNSHLSYALTWFAMAALLAGATMHALRRPHRHVACGEPLPTR